MQFCAREDSEEEETADIGCFGVVVYDCDYELSFLLSVVCSSSIF
jgi:hypothetical protein